MNQNHSVFDYPFLDMPNKMYPGTWVVLGIVLAAILTGFTYLLVKYLKSRVPWKKLPYLSTRYFGKNHQPDTELLVAGLKKVQDVFLKHCLPRQPKWTAEAVAKALYNVRIYVMDVDKWEETNINGQKTGRTIAGQQAGRNLIVGKNLAALLHEAAHRCEEVIDKERDMDHLTWPTDGIRAADAEFSAWMGTRTPKIQ